MEMKVQLVGEDATEATLHALQEWLKSADIEDFRIEREKARPAEGEMGDLNATLAVILGSAAVVEMVRAIHVWLKTRRRNVTFEFNIDGNLFKVGVDNFADDKAVIQTAEQLIKATTKRR